MLASISMMTLEHMKHPLNCCARIRRSMKSTIKLSLEIATIVIMSMKV